MLTRIHQYTKGWIAWFIASLIALTFVAFGFESYWRGQDKSNVVATVNGSKILMPLLNETTQLMVERITAEAGPDFQLTPVIEKQIRTDALNNLVTNQALHQAADKLGFYVGANQAEQILLNIPAFQENGQFSEQKFNQIMTNIRKHPKAFINEIQYGVLLNQQRVSFVGTAFAPDQEVDQAIALTYQTRDYRYALISAKNFTIDPKQLTDTVLNNYYEAHKDQYQTPERVKLSYVKLTVGDITKTLTITPEELTTYYQQNQATYTKPAVWQIAYITVSKPETVKAAFSAGQDFATVAKQYSEDVLSAKDGGVLPWMQAETMPENWRSHLDTHNKIIGPLAQNDKQVFIKIQGKQAAKTLPLSEIKNSLTTQLQQQKAQQIFVNKSEELANEAYQNPDSLESLGLPMQTTDWIEKTQPTDIASNLKVFNAAFNPELIEQGNNSDMLTIADDAVVVIRVTDHQAAQPKDFASVKAQVQAAVTAELQQQQAKAQGEQLLASKKFPDSLKWISIKKGNPYTNNVPTLIARTVFELKLNNPVTGSSVPNGDYMLAELQAIYPGDPSKLSSEQRQIIQTQLQTNQGLLAYELYQKAVLNKANIKRLAA